MPESDNNSPWGSSPETDLSEVPGSVFEMVPPPVASKAEAAAIPPMPTIPPPASLVPPPIPSSVASGGDSSVAEPLLSGDYDPRPDMPEPPGGGGGRIAWIGAVVGAFVLLLGGGYFALTALNAAGGAATPDEAVQKLIDAVNNEDFIALGEMLEPGERRTLVTPVVQDILPELERLGVLSGDFDPSGVEGLDMEFNDFTYRLENPVGHPDLVHVYATGGTTTFSTDADAFPFGTEIRSRFGDRMESQSDTTPATEDGTPLVLVERDGRWYVSIWFSAAESARIESDKAMPALSEQPQPLGSASPEGAVEGLILDLSDFDLERMLRRLDPEEAAALYRYSPLFLDDAQSEAQQFRQDIREEGIDWSITDMRFDVDRNGDDAIVAMTQFRFDLWGEKLNGNLEYGPDQISGAIEGELDGEDGRATLDMTPTRWAVTAEGGGESFEAEVLIEPAAETVDFELSWSEGDQINGSVEFDSTGGCSNYSWVVDGELETGCLESELGEVASDVYRGQIRQLFDMAEAGFPALTAAAHETDGEWYVSPTLSTMHWVTEGLRDIDEQEFREFLDRLDEQTEDSTVTPEELTAAFVVGSLPGVATPVLPVYVLGFGVSATDDWIDLGATTTETFSNDVPGPDETEFTPIEPGSFETDPVESTPAISFVVEPGVDPTPYRDRLSAEGDTHVYLVELDEGQALGVTLYGNDIVGSDGLGDPLLTLETPTGDFWLENDDFDGLNSGFQFVAPEAGQWRVVVADLNNQAGNYELTLERPEPGADATIGLSVTNDAPAEADIGDFEEIEVVPGSPIQLLGEVAPNVFDVVAFEVQPGSTVTITLEAVDGVGFDPRLIVRDQNLDILANVDDADPSAGLAPLDSQVVLTSSTADVFYVEVRSFADDVDGQYTLTISAT